MEVQYSAIAAKLKAMHANFLTDEDFEQLLSKKSVNDICSYLKFTKGYSQVLENVNEHDVHRGAMEILIEQNLVDEYVRLYNFIDHSKREIMEFWFMRHELEFLKREIRHIYTHEARSEDVVNRNRFEAFFNTHTKINREIMKNATSLSDCIEACKDTPYWQALKRAENLNADFFSMGMLLDSMYYDGMWKTINLRLDKSQRELIKRHMGTKIDLLNIMWIYRGKKYFDFENEIIFTYLLPVRYRLSEDVFKQMVTAPSAQSMVDIARTTVYGELFDGLEKGTFVEENYSRITYKLAKNIFINHPDSMAAVYEYLSLKEIEIKKIITIIEGIRYSQNPDSIREHINIS
ncbi:MAG: V-type ATPase subunit [Clostridia bacterium]|nr:V-type ATPase subunit [Clostridia bacterium]